MTLLLFSEVGRISDRDLWLTQEIAVFLANFVHTEKEMCAIPAEQNRARLWLPLWPDGW